VGVLIDSSVLIQHERGLLDVGRLLEGFGEGEGFVSAVTASELLHGVHRAQDVARQARRLASVEALLAAFPILPIDAMVARVHAQIWAHLKSLGTPVGAHDMWIGATCIAYGHAIVTGNVREFARIPGLVVRAG
jgi:tRNA(fMet)-specific endonuclease VapC